MADKFRASFFEVSAKTNTNIDDLFKEIINNALQVANVSCIFYKNRYLIIIERLAFH